MRLDQITMHDFIELYCGNYNVLPNEDNPKEVASNLIFEYMMITDPASSKSVIYNRGNRIKLKAKILLFQICSNLLAMKAYDEVKEIMQNYGYRDLTNENIEVKIKSLLNSALYENKRLSECELDKNKKSNSDIRMYFNKEVAFLMTFFKMQLDIKNISASIYANIVHQAAVQIKNFKRK